MTWSKSLPATSTKVIDVPSIFGGNQAEIDNITSVEHYELTNTMSGRHKVGQFTAMTVVTANSACSGIQFCAGPGGGLIFDGSIGQVRIGPLAADLVNPKNWPTIAAAFSSSRLVLTLAAASKAIAAAGGSMPTDTEYEDGLGEASNVEGPFVAADSGYYFWDINVGFTMSAVGQTLCGKAVVLCSTGAEAYSMTFCGQNTDTTAATPDTQLHFSDIVYLSAGEGLSAYFQGYSTTAKPATAFSASTHMTVRRVS